MIISKEPLSMAEATKYLEGEDEGIVETKKFIKKFVKTDAKKAEDMRKALEGLEMIKMRSEHIVKIIDLLPSERESLNKIFNETSLDEDETNKILETIKKFN